MALTLNKLPWYAQLGLFAAMTVVGAGAFYYYYETPARAAMEKQDKQLKTLRADLERARATAKKLPQFQADVTNLQYRLDSLRAVLPEEKDAADLLNRMQTVAAQSNMTIKGFRPSPTVTKQLHAEWPITLELEGTYHNLAIFFDRVGRFTRIVNISGLDVRARATADANGTISATCVATTFVLLDKPQPPKPGARGAVPAAAAPPAKSN